ncbi:MAG: hypothetical protein AAGH89_19495, partial [Verrucomicrobiota bacterium]
PHEELYFQFSSNRALRQGDWKLVSHRRGKWELYNLATDGTEMNDLASSNPERVSTMAARWEELAKTKDRLQGKNAAPVTENRAPLLQKDGRPASSTE